MSLASLAIRLATIRALKGRTFAGEKVFDSKIDPINLIASTGGYEFAVVVTTDDDDISIEGRDLFAGDHKMELVIEVAATAPLTVETGEGEQAEAITIPPTDAGLEITLNLIGWQIGRALAAGGGEWGDLWRRLVMRVDNIASRRGASEENGVRYAARQYIYRIDHIAEPEPGIAPTEGSLWAQAIAMLKADPDYAPIGKVIESTIVSDTPEPWERVRAALGLADDASEWISEKPFVDDAEPLSAIELEDGFVIDSDTAEAADGPEDGA